MFSTEQIKTENKFNCTLCLKMGIGSQEDMGNTIKVRILKLAIYLFC